MAKAAEQKRNSYEDADFKQQLDAVEAIEEAARLERKKIAEKMAKDIEVEIKTVVKLGVSRKLFNAVRATRKDERRILSRAEGLPEDLIELYADASGQFSFLKPETDEKVVTPAQVAAKRAAKAAKENQAAEQEEGAKILRAQHEGARSE